MVARRRVVGMDVLSSVVETMRTGTPTSYRVRFEPPFGRSYPVQPGAGFHVVLQGSCWLRPYKSDPVQLNVGDVVLLPHGYEHGLSSTPDGELILEDSQPSPAEQATSCVIRIGPDGPSDGVPCEMVCGVYQLDRSRPHMLLDELPEVIHLPARLGHHPSLRGAIELFSAELEELRPGAEALAPNLLEIILVLILRTWLAEQPCPAGEPGWASAMRDPAISTALDAIHSDPGRPWTVESLGAEAGLSRAAFARRFAGLLSMPPLTYLTWWRMTVAARLLRDTDRPLNSIAREIGYASEFAFANAFKREFGRAPGQYRRT